MDNTTVSVVLIKASGKKEVIQMGQYSKDKGKRGEREVVALLKKHGISARRTAQYCGKSGEASDVVGLKGYNIEVKFVEKLNIDKAYEQATRDAEEHYKKTGEVLEPLVIYRKSRTKWKAVIDAERFVELLKSGKEDKHG